MERHAALLVAALLGAAATSCASATGGPPGAVIHLEADRTDWLLGEDPFLLFIVENRGTEPLSLSLGGDFRGTSRPTRFTVTATREDGLIAPDPHPGQVSMGGALFGATVEPGGEWVFRLPLSWYRTIREPGPWTIAVHHDLGWKEAPTASVRLRFRPPLPFETRLLVDAALSLSPDAGAGWWWEERGLRSPAPPTLLGISHPAYLPALLDAARRGEVRAVAALGRIDAPDATRALADLSGSPNPAVADAAAEELVRRGYGSTGTEKPWPWRDRGKPWEQ